MAAMAARLTEDRMKRRSGTSALAEVLEAAVTEASGAGDDVGRECVMKAGDERRR